MKQSMNKPMNKPMNKKKSQPMSQQNDQETNQPMNQPTGSDNLNRLNFTKDQTLIAKGLFIILLLSHHLFYFNNLETYHIKTIIQDENFLNYLFFFCKICVGGFVFLSAYGITLIFMSQKENCGTGTYFSIMINRLLKLLFSFWPVFFLALIAQQFMGQKNVMDFYRSEGYFRPLYMVFDGLGLSKYFQTPTLNITWWYLTLAIILIILMPLIYMLVKKFGWLVFIPAFFILPYMLDQDYDLGYLIPTMILGTICAKDNLLNRLRNLGQGRKLMKAAKAGISVVLVIISFQIMITLNAVTYCYALTSFLFVYISFEFLSCIPVLNMVMKRIGKNASNIFFTHTFIYYYYFSKFIFSFQYDLLILLALLLSSLLLSEAIELVKKIVQYQTLVNKVLGAVNKHIS